ncbi:MAG: ChaN family lipoprotein, partial [bacterium]|nr:ChaN family lipoprotein [bacterium]
MKTNLTLILAVVLLAGCGPRQDKEPLDSTGLFELKQYLVSNQLPPIDYVVSKFVDHDVVFLGEFHRIKDNPLLVQQLIPHLYESGVYTLATEFAGKAEQALIDSLLSSDTYDESLARHIQMTQYSLWPWQEYLDIYRAAWELNRSLPDTARQFRILGTNCDLDWTPVETKEDFQKPEIRRQVWKGCSERDWAEVVLEPVRQGEKVLVHCGTHHAFTRYRQPVVDSDGKFVRFGDVRVGNYVREEIGDRAMSIYMHGLWFGLKSEYGKADRRPIAGAIDQLMAHFGPEAAPAGFDVLDTPFGKLSDDEAIYSAGYENFTLADFCDGYIWFRPFAEVETVSFAEGFYNEDNIEVARIRTSQPAYRDAVPMYFERRMRKQLERETA